MRFLWFFIFVLSSVECLDSEDMESFVSWFQLNGGVSDHLKLRPFSKQDGGGCCQVVYDENNNKNTHLLDVPFNISVHALNLAYTPLSSILKKTMFIGDESDVGAAILLLYEKSLGKASRFAPFIDILPAHPTCSFTIKNMTALSTLPAGEFFRQTVVSEGYIRDDRYARATASLKSVFAEKNMKWPPSWWDLNQFTWALAIVQTRSWGLILKTPEPDLESMYGKYAPQRVVLPFMHLINHKACYNPPLNMWDPTSDPKRVRIFSEKPLENGQTVWECYGSQDSFSLLKTFGFALDECTPDDEVALSPLPPDDSYEGHAWLIVPEDGSLSSTLVDAARIIGNEKARNPYEVILQWIEEEMSYYGVDFDSSFDHRGLMLDGTLLDHWERVRRCKYRILERAKNKAKAMILGM